MYLFRVTLLRESATVPSESKHVDAFYVADTIEQVWAEIALDRADTAVEIEGVKREVPVLKVIQPEPEK